jgi:tRNA dimethylallyltransferase
MKKPIFCLMGPTASGKTQIAVELVQQFPLEIISVDSAMVYKGLDVGTAKPDNATLSIAPHRLIDIKEVQDIYSAGEFRRDALLAIAEIYAQGRIPLLVGGTMLYYKVLQFGLAELPLAQAEIRAQLQSEAETLGWSVLHERLQTLDPLAAKKIAPQDKQRIQRALEVYLQTGKPISAWQQEQGEVHQDYEFYNLALIPPSRQSLAEKIAQRFQLMLQAGFIDEVEKLYVREELSADLPALRSVGYKQVWQYLQGVCDFKQMQTLAITATRQLAKRQLTWLRRWPKIENFVLAAETQKNIANRIQEILQKTG